MAVDHGPLLSALAQRLRASEIRELLKLLDRPQMISFAGGLPNPAAFPSQELERVLGHVMAEHAAEALQYGPTEGHQRLRRAIAEGMGTHYGARQTVESVVLTAGSQQALSLLSTVVLDPGDVVLTASPTYLGALLTFNTRGARVEGIASDAQGMLPDALEARLTELQAAGARVKMVYLVPTFDNPTGGTMPAERRERIYELVARFGVLLVEDDPYGLLRYDGEPVAPIKSLDGEGRVAYLGSFSKILAPGFRVGWLAADPQLTRKVTLAKQAEDLCTSTFGQYCVFEAIAHDVLFPHVEVIKRLYRAKRDLMLAAADRHFPEGVTYNRPEGGMFLWVTLPRELDSLELLPRAIDHDVAYVIGRPFFPDGSGHNTLRLNFSYASDEQIDEGIQRLAAVFRQALSAEPPASARDHIGIF